jgi:hypothetical protein
MDRELINSILPVLSKEMIQHLHQLLGSEPVSFAALQRAMVHEIIEEGLNEQKSIKEISCQAGVCRRTVERYRNKKLLRIRMNRSTKKDCIQKIVA